MKVTLLDTGRNALARAQAYGTKIRVSSYDIGSRHAANSILDVQMVTSGHGFQGEPPVQVVGDGSGAVLKAVMSGDQVTDIIVINGGMGYTYAQIVIGGTGIGAAATAIVGPKPDLQAAVQPVMVNGAVSDINVNFVTPNEFRYLITLDESVGDFDIGNILLKLEDGTPFLFGTLDNVIKKQKTNPPFVPVGNRLVINMTLKYANVAGLIEVNLTDTVYLNPPSVPTQEELPDPTNTPYDLFLVQNDTRLGRPTLAMRQGTEPLWYSVPFTEETFSGSFGPALDGGVIQENPYAVGSRRVTGGGGYVRYGVRQVLTGGNYSQNPEKKRNFGTWE